MEKILIIAFDNRKIEDKNKIEFRLDNEIQTLLKLVKMTVYENYDFLS